MTKYFKITDNQGCWCTKYFTGTELKEYCNSLLDIDDSNYRVRNIEEAIDELYSLDFEVIEITKKDYIDNEPI